MADHYCVEHQQPWFKKGNMRGYAHPIKDEAGVTTGWCNEDKPIHTVEGVAKEMAGSPEPSGQPQGEMSKADWAEKDRITRKSFERQTSLNNAANIICAMIAQGKEMSTTKTLDIAKLFEAYLEGISIKEVKTESALVKEAKKLGGKVVNVEVKEENE